jgi:hypothetical protein
VQDPDHFCQKGHKKRNPAIVRVTDMKKEYDFSKGVRGKFHHTDAQLNFPIYLEPEVADFVDRLAKAKKIDVNQVVNLLLKKDKELIEYGR